MRVLIPHGTTKTGFGVGQIDDPRELENPDDAVVVLLSRCCGSRLGNWSSDLNWKCLNCKKDFNGDPVSNDWNLTFTGEIPKTWQTWDIEDQEALSRMVIEWLQGITGEDDLEMMIEW